LTSISPRRYEEAIHLLALYGEQARILTGGTALLLDMQHGEIAPTHLISLDHIPGLSTIHDTGVWHIAALSTISDLASFAETIPPLRALVDSVWLFGGRLVRNMCTVGGNICKASPGAAMVPPLLCLDAALHLSGTDERRTTPLDGFLIGKDQTEIRSAEMLTEISLPPLPRRTGTAFFKVMRRHAMDCSIVAARITLADDGETCVEARVALGAVAPNPFRAKAAESLLIGKKLSAELIREAARAARDESRPISDVRASAEYRRMLIKPARLRMAWLNDSCGRPRRSMSITASTVILRTLAARLATGWK
jgi:CO/xanthine dehydrogenase FAD-binding subunit